MVTGVIALCISCSYPGTRLALPNAAQDADKVAGALRASSFTVERLLDPDKNAMREAIAQFKRRLDGYGGSAVGVVHFSGHSSGIDGAGNFLLPVGPAPASAGELQANGYPLRSVVEELSTARAMRFRILLEAAALPPDRIERVTGFGDRRPRLGNPGAAGNNRIEVILLRTVAGQEMEPVAR